MDGQARKPMAEKQERKPDLGTWKKPLVSKWSGYNFLEKLETPFFKKNVIEC